MAYRPELLPVTSYTRYYTMHVKDIGGGGGGGVEKNPAHAIPLQIN